MRAAGPQLPLADTGADLHNAGFKLIWDENDCLLGSGIPYLPVSLGGASIGSFPIAVGVPSVPTGFDGIASFSFLNRFTYGNFGDPSQFGLEC